MLYVFSELNVKNFRPVKTISEQTNAKIILVGCNTTNCKTKEKFRNLPNSEFFLERRGSKDCCQIMLASKLGELLNYNDNFLIVSDNDGYDAMIKACNKNGYNVSRLNNGKVIKPEVKSCVFHENLKNNGTGKKLHVLVDSENVGIINDFPEGSDFIIFCNKQNCKNYENFNAKVVTCETSGKNSLDFQLALYLSQILNKDDQYIICSGDYGYDSVAEHYRNLGYNVTRKKHGRCKRKTNSGLNIGGKNVDKIQKNKMAKNLLNYLKQKSGCQMGKTVTQAQAITALSILLANKADADHRCIQSFLDRSLNMIPETKAELVMKAKEETCDAVACLVERYYRLIIDVLR